MKNTSQLIPFCLISLSILIACSSAQPTNQEPAGEAADTATVALTAATEASAGPTEGAFHMPAGRLLVYTNLGKDGGQYQIINLPDLTAEPYDPLNNADWFFDRSIVLSPGGHYLVYVRKFNQDSPQYSLNILEIGTGISTKIADGSQSNGQPTWTADGKLLEFDNFDQGLYIYNVETDDLRHIAVSSEYSDQSAISPSGDQIAYVGACPGNLIACPVDLYIVNSDGTGERYLEKGDIDWIFWSRDGRFIYYSLYGDRETYGNSGELTDSGYRLHYFDLESGQSSSIEDWKFNAEAQGSWYLSPNGEFLAYQFGFAGVKVVKTSNYSLIDLLPVGDDVAWSPDSRYLAINSFSGDWYLYDIETGLTETLDVDLQSSQIVGWLP